MSVGKLLLCFFLISALLASCSSPQPNLLSGLIHGDILDKPAEQVLSELNLDEQSYSLLPLCEKVKAYVNVGTYNLDIAHGAVMAPTWMLNGLDRYSEEMLTQCLLAEGKRQLSLWHEESENQTEISFAIHAIFYTLRCDSFKRNPDVREFMLSAFCDHELVFPGSLLIQLYVWMDGDLSEEIGPNTDLVRLASEEREFVCQASR